jgi:hypothetical protein
MKNCILSIKPYEIWSFKECFWTINVDLSPIFKSSCKPSSLTWFHKMKHNFNTCLNKYNIVMLISTLHHFFIEAPHFFLESPLPSWDCFGIDVQFFWMHIKVLCNIQVMTFVKSLGPYLTFVPMDNHVPT